MTGLGEEKLSGLTHTFLNCTAFPTGEGGASRIFRGKAGPTKPAKWLEHVLVVIREESIALGGLQETSRGFLWFKKLGQYRSCLSYIFILSLSPFIFFSLQLSPFFLSPFLLLYYSKNPLFFSDLALSIFTILSFFIIIIIIFILFSFVLLNYLE
jgi:hypothetical protein